MKMPALFPALFLSIALSCSSGARKEAITPDLLEQISIIADTKPDSAFAAIKSISQDQLRSRKSIARYAMVHSKVLDKNHIDITSDSIIAPALQYYSRKRSCKELHETYYYAARIQENIGNNSKAMEFLQKAESKLENDADVAAGLIYSAKARLYHNSIEYEEAAQNYRKASEIYELQNDRQRALLNRIREADCKIKGGRYGEAYQIITSIEAHLDLLPEKSLNKYYQVKISYLEKTDIKEAGLLAETYTEKIQDESIIDWIMLARIKLIYGDADYAMMALEKHQTYNGRNGVYFYFLAKAYEVQGKWYDATEAYKEYIRKHSQIGASILSQDTKFIEERHRHQEMHEREETRRIILSLIITASLLTLALAALAIATIRKQLKIESLQRENLQRQIDELMTEREELAVLQTRNQEGRKIITERLRIIDQFVMSDAFNDRIFEAKASETLKKIINDREEFVRQNRLIFNQSATNFINYLTDRGLDEREIDHCCLYAIGMNGKMVTVFTKVKRHYHIGSDVRKKLGLSGRDTNISIYIRKLYKALESEEQTEN